MTIIVGREANSSNPRLSVAVDGNIKNIGTPGSVPMSVSRKHCRIEIQPDGSMTVACVAEGNVMYVNGVEFKFRSVSQEDMVELGPDKYLLDIPSVVRASSAAAAQADNVQNILPLKKVWDDYQDAKTRIQVKNGRIGALSAIPGVISMGSIALCTIPALEHLRIVFVIIAVVFALTFAIIRLRGASKNPVEQRRMDEAFQDQYVCPNPSCHHFLGNQPYRLVLKNGSCPWCKSKYVEVEE